MKLKEFDINYNSIGDYSKDLRFYDFENKEQASYWTDNNRVYFRSVIIKNADINSFVVLNRFFAKDKNRCYLQGRMLKNADSKYFETLNYCYAKDNRNAWTTGGIVKNIDIKTFEVCDEGIRKNKYKFSRQEFNDGKMREVKILIPYGYAKDKNNVYYENFSGKPKIVKKANPKTFKSLNNGLFGLDDTLVFYEQSTLKKANPNHWKLIDEEKSLEYSKDEKSIYSYNKEIKNADLETFKLYPIEKSIKLYGKGGVLEGEKKSIQYYGTDKFNIYNGANVTTLKEIEQN